MSRDYNKLVVVLLCLIAAGMLYQLQSGHQQPECCGHNPGYQVREARRPAIGSEGTYDANAFTGDVSTAKGLWEGLSEADLQRHGLNIKGKPFIPFIDLDDPKAVGMNNRPKRIQDMTFTQAEARFRQLCMMNQLQCAQRTFVGNTRDGGYDVCLSSVYKPQPKGIIYSFGIRNEFSFDDGMFKQFQCCVKAFDPSMKQNDHKRSDGVYFYKLGIAGSDEYNTTTGWKMLTFGSILRKFGHETSVIEMMKFDIERSDMEVLREMLNTGTLRNVKQLAFEVHLFADVRQERDDYLHWYNILLELERQGFRKYIAKANDIYFPEYLRTGRKQTCCYIVHYINLKFIMP